MKNQNNNAIIDLNRGSDQWFNRNLAFAIAGIAASLAFGALVNQTGRAFVATLIGLN